MAAIWPDVVNKLLTVLPGLPSWSDVDCIHGPPNVATLPPDYCTVGYATDDTAGSFTQSHEHDYLVAEDGTVLVVISSQTGDSVLTDVQARAFTLYGELDAFIRADQTLGGLVHGPVMLAANDILTPANKAGVAVQIISTLTYHTETVSPG